MDDLNLLGPQLALLIGAGVIIIVDLLLPFVSREAYLGRRPLLSGLALLAAAGSLGWSLALVLSDERGEAFDALGVFPGEVVLLGRIGGEVEQLDALSATL